MLATLEMATASPSADALPTAHWAVVATHPQAERWAAANLNRIGYETYLPLYAARVRDRVLRTLTRLVHRPLFPGYLFVAIDGPWTPIRYAPGVRELLMDDGRPSICPRASVEALQAHDELRRTSTPPGAAWPPGTPCSLATGV